jgi:outer membrane protein assembly factor BamB
VREDNYVIVGTAGRNDERGDVQGYLMAVSLKRGQEGIKLWETKFSDPYMPTSANASIALITVYPEDGVFICTSTVSLGGSKYLKYWGYDMKTGQLLWITEPEPDMNYYSQQVNYYNGLLLTSGYGGVVIAYNITTGKQVWNYTAVNVGFESPYGNYPINIFAIADGKIYTLTGEHSITQPMWRGPNIRCINASNGAEIWKVMGFGANGGAHLTGMYMQMADGKVLGLSYFDNKIYCIGKGSSATTVSAPQTVPSLGSSLMITGTVTDQTPTGSHNTNDKIDFTLKGTPAISDEDMGAWMEYLFMNQGMPANAKGVEVTLDAIDPNNNFVHIGTVTSDNTGAYGCLFTPEVPGTYQIIATFAGSKSYGASFAETYLAVGEAPPPTVPPPEYPQPIDNTLTIVVTGVAIIIAVAIVGILLLRKK